MFEFIYKMFGEGYAAVPAAGMEAIPRQLFEGLRNTTFKFNTEVTSVKDGELILGTGEKLESHFTIVATEASGLINNLSKQALNWRSCDTLYFKTKGRVISKPIIGLVPNEGSLINNIFYLTSLKADKKGGGELLSVTVVKHHDLTPIELIDQVQKELKQHCGIDAPKFIRHYKIPQALPDLKNVQYEMLPSETRLTASIFLAGDTQLNASLNAAMIAGERAALGLIETALDGRS
jgi:hypothetical protein